MFLQNRPVVVVTSYGWVYVEAHEVILWYDWEGEYHYLDAADMDGE